MTHLALLDSTGWGFLNSPHDPAGIFVEDGCAFVVSPGSSLSVEGQRSGQSSLVQAVAHGESALVPFFSGTSPIRVIAIKSEDSIAVSAKKTNKRYKNMSMY